MKLITELKLNIGYSPDDIINNICSKLKCDKSDIKEYHIVKESIDARKEVKYVLNVAVEFSKLNKYTKKLNDYELDFKGIETNNYSTTYSPVIVGFGPSGMFCALALAKMGLRPIVLEQGKPANERAKDVQLFWEEGKLNKYSNVHYGEGGAGTFSDGKLNSNINNKYYKKVINEFILHGAPKEIFYKSKPHIGTDNLQQIVKSIREEIKRLGGQVIFNAKLIDFTLDEIKILTYINTLNNTISTITTDRLILAIGHSPIETFSLLKEKGFKLTPKPFAMGVRIEHPQMNINLAQYGMIDDRLPNADYKLVEHLENGRSVFTFCMCPGGQIVASSSEENGIVTNGMSNFARNSPFANSALLVNVLPEDYFENDPLDGFYYQRIYEKKAFEVAGSDYSAPAQSVQEFLGSERQDLACSYRPKISICDISKCLPDFVTESLKLALPRFNKRLKGFTDDAILVAIESRSSSPVTIVRDNITYQSVNFKNIYPIGEGAGYAGGIITSAVDGLKCALSIEAELK